MVVDQLSNSGLYEGLHAKLPDAFAFIRKYLGEPMAEGRYVIDGSTAYALVQGYATAPAEQKKWESHRKYVDVQFIADGSEAMLWANAGELAFKGEYLPEKDFQGYEDGPSTALRCAPGTFAVFFPNDAHKPGCMLNEACAVKKIVVKLAIE